MKTFTILKDYSKIVASLVIMLAITTGFAQQERHPSHQYEIGIAKNQNKTINSTDEINDYCIPSGEEYDYFYCEDFVFAGIENLSTGCGENGYQDFTDMQGSVEIGETYIAKIRGTMFGGSSYLVANIWIDLDGNEVFDASELLLQDAPVNENLLEFPVSIPGNAIAGLTRLRVVVSFMDLNPSEDPCAALQDGEWEDYSIEISGSSTGNDAKAVSIDIDYPLFETGEVIPIATVKNEGTNTVEIPVVCTVDGSTYTSSKTTAPLAPGELVQITFDAWNADAAGVFLMHVNTELEGDENTSNNEITMTVSIAPFIPEKRILVEEGTGTWCGWCVRGIVAVEHMNDMYPNSWIGVSVHFEDPMANIEWINDLGLLFYPSSRVMRGLQDDASVEYFEESYQQEMSIIAPASCEITSNSLNSTTNTISLTVESEFILGGEGYRFSAFVIENGVTGEGAEWNQANYYSGGDEGPMGGFEDLANPIPAADMVYNDVARVIIGDIDGVEGSIPAVVEYGETHSYTFETAIDPSWNPANLVLVGLLINPDGSIANAQKSELTVGINDIEKEDLNVYPNPASNNIHIANMERGDIQIYNLNGTLVKTISDVEGDININVSELNTGIYFVKSISDKEIRTAKVSLIE